MFSSPKTEALLIWLAWVLCGTFLTHGPDSFRNRFDAVVIDGTGRSLTMLDELGQHLTHWSQAARRFWTTRSTTVDSTLTPHPSGNSTAATGEELAQLQQQNQDLLASLAWLQAENARLRTPPEITFPLREQRLTEVHALPVRVIGQQGRDGIGHQGVLLSAGSRQGIAGDELILRGDGVLIDQGDRAQLQPDELVTFGRSLFGRTLKVGRSTTLVQPITDPEFRTAARIVRNTEYGPVLGTSGILQGTGDACRLVEVPGTEAVAVGDFVYTDALVSPTAIPICIGSVTSVQIEDNASHWLIEVRPVLPARPLPRSLTVLQTELKFPKDRQTSPVD